MEIIICILIVCITVIIVVLIYNIYDYKKNVNILKNNYGEQVNAINNHIIYIDELITAQNIILTEIKDKLKIKIKEENGESI